MLFAISCLLQKKHTQLLCHIINQYKLIFQTTKQLHIFLNPIIISRQNK